MAESIAGPKTYDVRLTEAYENDVKADPYASINPNQTRTYCYDVPGLISAVPKAVRVRVEMLGEERVTPLSKEQVATH